MMAKNISDEFKLLATAANYIKEEFERDSSVWKESPFD